MPREPQKIEPRIRPLVIDGQATEVSSVPESSRNVGARERDNTEHQGLQESPSMVSVRHLPTGGSCKPERISEVASPQLDQSIVSTTKTKSNPQSTNKNRGPGGIKISRAEMLLRIRVVEGLMLRGFLGRDVQRALDKQFGKTIPWYTVQKYIRHVAAMWEEEDALARPYRRARQLRQLHDVADQLMEDKAWREWLETQRLIARIEGNEAPLQHELSVHSKFEGWTVEELEAYAQSNGKTVPKRFQVGQQSSAIGQLPEACEG